MSADVDIRLIGPLQKIAQLAIDRTDFYGGEDLDLFHHRTLIRASKVAVIAYLRDEVERRTDRKQTVREISHTLIRGLGLSVVYCVICPMGTPAGVVTARLDDTHAFAVTGSANGYIRLSYK